MNEPEYILTDEMEVIATAIKANLALPVLNYQYGYVEELNETLKQYENNPAQFDQKFPLLWLAEPFTTERKDPNIYGTVDADLYIITGTDKTWKARDRMANNYKPKIFPIYRQLLKELVLSVVFSFQAEDTLAHKTTKGYYWGEAQKTVLNDAVDCLRISGLKLRLNHNSNCTLLKSF